MTRPPAGTPCYFASWTGYDPPLHPHNPITYERAEASRAFTVFIFDEQGRAVSFEKWLATATRGDPHALAGRRLPAGKVFFAPDGADRRRPGRALSLEETQGTTEYFRASTHPDGEIISLEHVSRERMIHHQYGYWEDGRLREYRFDAGDGYRVDTFDRDGNLLSSTTEGVEG